MIFADLQALFQVRELAFIYEDDRHVRYRSFEDTAEFEQELCKANPQKIDIGAVYNHKVYIVQEVKSSLLIYIFSPEWS